MLFKTRTNARPPHAPRGAPNTAPKHTHFAEECSATPRATPSFDVWRRPISCFMCTYLCESKAVDLWLRASVLLLLFAATKQRREGAFRDEMKVSLPSLFSNRSDLSEAPSKPPFMSLSQKGYLSRLLGKQTRTHVHPRHTHETRPTRFRNTAPMIEHTQWARPPPIEGSPSRFHRRPVLIILLCERYDAAKCRPDRHTDPGSRRRGCAGFG